MRDHGPFQTSWFQGSDFVVLGIKLRGFRDQKLVVLGIATSWFQGSRLSKSPLKSSIFPAYPHPVTRARDLNKELTLLTSHPNRRLKRGLRPLSASNPPNPPYPHKARPSGEHKIQKEYRAAALRPAGK